MDGAEKRSSRPKSRQSIAHLPSLTNSHPKDRGNTTVDLSTLGRKQDAQASNMKKKLRGKSLGPGGLEALTETTGNALKVAASLQIKSILKPTVPLTPPKSIPTFDELRKRSTTKGRSPGKNVSEDLLIDFSTPAPSRETVANMAVFSAEALVDPFSPAKVDNLQVSAPQGNHDDDEEKRRQAEKKEILERRAARRKSMANRRVSFAPEATLHTWSVMELVEDSTTSSASNSTRRQSAITATQSPAPKQGSDLSDPPSTPPKQIEEDVVEESPAHQRELHQRKRRRSSGISADMEMSEDDVYSSSPSGDLTTNSSPLHVEDSINSESDTDGDTAMSMDEITSNTVNSHASASSTHSSLDERLRQAANLAGTKGIEYDEHGDDDMSMEMATSTVTHAFQPWARGQREAADDPAHDQENILPPSQSLSGRRSSSVTGEEEDEGTQGMTMDITKAIGGIVSSGSPSKSRRKSTISRRRSSVAPSRSTDEDSSLGDETMDFTTVGGGILSGGKDIDQHESEDESDDEMTMDFTTAVGKIREGHGRRESNFSTTSDGNETMDMTAAVGGILEAIEEQTEPQTDIEDDGTVGMEMTMAVGQIMKHPGLRDAVQMQQTTKEEVDVEYPDLSMVGKDTSQPEEPMVPGTPRQFTAAASETGSPNLTLKPRSSARSRTKHSATPTTPQSVRRGTPNKTPSSSRIATPTKQMTPVPTRAASPERTPVAANVTHRGASPKRLFQAEIKARASPGSIKKSPVKKHNPLFSHNEETGHQTPRVILHAPKPHQHLRRRSSGIGIDKEGNGSPRVSELLDRRTSIVESAPEFKVASPRKSRLRFEDPSQLAHEVDVERAEEERRESGRFIMEQEADERQEENATLQLKEMIDSMTPRKDKTIRLKGRKSLAVGSARGLLGKRPAELDDAEDEDGENTPKRLRTVSREASPVKKVHLPRPPTKEETTGRLTRAQQLALANAHTGNATPTIPSSPNRDNGGSSPQPVNRFRDLPANDDGTRPTSFEDKLDNVIGAVDVSITHPESGEPGREEERVSLQQFLNMTNIHFIELSTTKRRHTMAQSLSAQPLQEGMNDSTSTESTFVAAATTLPLLDLYQHATRELKSYISTGRKIIRSIEADTLAVQPRLFREYMEARPDVKAVMDNQFRNGKTNARMQSKEGWYTWRSQLVDGLRDGLTGIKNDIHNDLSVLQDQQNMLSDVVPSLSNKSESLGHEFTLLQQRLVEIESVDHEALRASRKELQAADYELSEKRALLATLQQQMQDKEEALSQAAELKTEMHDQIGEANRVREENRGWPAREVVALKAKVDAITKKTGWSLVRAEEDYEENDFGVALTLTYTNELTLFLYLSAYQVGASKDRRRSVRPSRSVSGPSAPISLVHIVSSGEGISTPELPTEQRFFLQVIRSQLHAYSMMPKGSVAAKTLLDTVSGGWDIAQRVSEEIRMLNMAGLTRVAIVDDETLSVKLSLMTKGRSRVDISFVLSLTISSTERMSTSTVVSATAVYGPITSLLDVSKTGKVQTALTRETESKKLGEGAWISAIHAFEVWHTSQTQPKPEPEKVGPTVTSTPTKSRSNTTTLSPLKTRTVKRSPLTAKKTTTIQKKALPVPTSRQQKPTRDLTSEKIKLQDPFVTGKENIAPMMFGNSINGSMNVNGSVNGTTGYDQPAIPPELQEVMMRTPIKRVGALRRSPV